MNSIWHGIRRWWSRFTWKIGKSHRNVVKIARKGSWFDHGYLMHLMMAKLNEMQAGFDSDRAICIGAEERAAQMRTAIRLMQIVWGPTETFTFGEHKDLEHLEENYRCLVNVNLRNIDRFAKTPYQKEMFKKMPSELYEEKAYQLLFKYLEHHLRDWWD